MAKYLFIYRGVPDPAQDTPNPEQLQAIMAEWGAWFEKVGPAVVDGGDGLLPTGKIVHANGTVTDGPFIEAKEVVGGYSILNANSYDEAAELAKSCPICRGGGNIEIRELAGFGG